MMSLCDGIHYVALEAASNLLESHRNAMMNSMGLSRVRDLVLCRVHNSHSWDNWIKPELSMSLRKEIYVITVNGMNAGELRKKYPPYYGIKSWPVWLRVKIGNWLLGCFDDAWPTREPYKRRLVVLAEQ
jgi:hypothetical protein